MMKHNFTKVKLEFETFFFCKSANYVTGKFFPHVLQSMTYFSNCLGQESFPRPHHFFVHPLGTRIQPSSILHFCQIKRVVVLANPNVLAAWTMVDGQQETYVPSMIRSISKS